MFLTVYRRSFPAAPATDLTNRAAREPPTSRCVSADPAARVLPAPPGGAKPYRRNGVIGVSPTASGRFQGASLHGGSTTPAQGSDASGWRSVSAGLSRARQVEPR
ncbi:hypothetical protein GN956_G26744 [Arapaima gigas]